MRIVKEAEERKNEILDAAERLFNEKGYDGTSTNDILEVVGIARGTLYYHFKSKESILEALVDRYSKQIIERAEKASRCQTDSIPQRIVKVIQSLNVSQYHEGRDEVYEELHHVQNSLLHQRVQGMMIASVTPILARLVEEGVESGLFDTQTPYISMEMMMIYATSLLDNDLIPLSDEEKLERMKGMLVNVQRMLGCSKEVMDEIFVKIFQG